MPSRWKVVALVLCTLTACVRPIPRPTLPIDAAVTANEKNPPPLEIGESEKPTAENPFTSDAILPCRDAEDRAEARKAIESLSAEIGTLDESSSALALEKAQRRLHALIDTPCFELAKADLREPLEFDSAFALRTWWWDGGGESALHLRVSDDRNDRYPSIAIAGQPVPSLLLAGHETHPLAPLLCAATDYECGRDTRGWVRRATAIFRSEHRQTDAAECEKTLLDRDPEERWAALVDCEVSAAPTEAVLPLGRFRAMTDGYFVLTHAPHGNCGSLEVYDLASGTAIKSSSCHRNAVQIGRVPLASLREAAWMMTLAAYAKDDVRQATVFTIPERVVPGRTREEEGVDRARLLLGGGYGRSGFQAWTWYRRVAGKVIAQVTGTTHGPASPTASRYAVELLRIIAEESFVEGCAPSFSAASLGSIPWKESGPFVHEKVSLGFDLASADLDAAREAIARAKTPAKCAGPM